jgi:putative membrane protein
MEITAKRIGIIAAGIIVGLIFAAPTQMIFPFPVGLSFGIVVWVLFIIIFVVVAFDITKNDGKSSLAILEERYAKGEITKEEFDKMKEDLT